MDSINTAALKEQLARTIGPAPWYWKSYPVIESASGQKLYCRPFLAGPGRVGVWCPEGRNLRFTCFDLKNLKSFDLAEIAGWFKQSADRIYSATEPVADFEVPLQLPPGTHSIDVPAELRDVEELIVPTTYAARSSDDPAMALFVFYFHAGLVVSLAADDEGNAAQECSGPKTFAENPVRFGIAGGAADPLRAERALVTVVLPDKVTLRRRLNPPHSPPTFPFPLLIPCRTWAYIDLNPCFR